MSPEAARRLRFVLAACGAVATVGLGITIAVLMAGGTPPLRLGSQHAAPPDSAGASGAAAGAAGAGAAPDCALPGGAPACPAMVAVPAGRYRPGAPRDDPYAQEEELGGVERPVAAFELSAHEITAGQWQVCVNDGACPPPAAPAESAAMPVTGVSWDAAAGYAAWLSRKSGQPYRLPTEAEWEYAARGGARTVFPWGDQLGERQAHCGQCGTLEAYPRFAPAGSFPAWRGLHDMVGNAYEWVADCWTPSHRHAAPAERACRDKVQKGGAYDSLEADVRPAARTHGPREAGDPRVGFRVARDAAPSAAPAPLEKARP